MAKAPPTWETFRDRSYYDMWAVRMVGDRTFGQGVHVMTQLEAEGLRDLLNTTSQAEALRAEVERLREALAFYADSPCNLEFGVVNECPYDDGDRARAALSETMP